MPRSYELSGPKTPEAHRELAEEIERARAKARCPVEGEVEKTSEHRTAIRLTNEIIGQAIGDLGLEASALALEQVHMLEERAFAKFSGRPSWERAGFARAYTNEIIVRIGTTAVEREMFSERFEQEKERRDDAAIDVAVAEGYEEVGDAAGDAEREAVVDRILAELRAADAVWAEHAVRVVAICEQQALLNTIVHEAFHLQAFQHFVAIEGEKDLRQRSGYDYYRDGDATFVSVNEAITQRMTDEAIARASDRCHVAGFPPVNPNHFSDPWVRDEVAFATGTAYADDQRFLGRLMAAVAEQKGESTDAVWRRFQRSYVTGSMMHLRDIEHAFGKGALRFVAGVAPRDFEDYQRRELVWQYLETNDAGERTRIADELARAREGGPDKRGADARAET